jgi:hypothetical protein
VPVRKTATMTMAPLCIDACASKPDKPNRTYAR